MDTKIFYKNMNEKYMSKINDNCRCLFEYIERTGETLRVRPKETSLTKISYRSTLSDAFYYGCWRCICEHIDCKEWVRWHRDQWTCDFSDLKYLNCCT